MRIHNKVFIHLAWSCMFGAFRCQWGGTDCLWASVGWTMGVQGHLMSWPKPDGDCLGCSLHLSYHLRDGVQCIAKIKKRWLHRMRAEKLLITYPPFINVRWLPGARSWAATFGGTPRVGGRTGESYRVIHHPIQAPWYGHGSRFWMGLWCFMNFYDIFIDIWWIFLFSLCPHKFAISTWQHLSFCCMLQSLRASVYSTVIKETRRLQPYTKLEQIASGLDMSQEWIKS